MSEENNIEEIDMYVSQVAGLSWDIADLEADLNSAPASCVWSITEGSSVTLGTDSFSTTEVSCFITAASTGCSVVRALVTMADSVQQEPFYFKITVTEPSCT